MAEDSSSKESSGQKEGESNSEGGRIWRGIRALLFGEEETQSLRDEIEDVIANHEGDDNVSPHSKRGGDLSAIERQMLRNLLHFSEHEVDDVAVPRGDIIAIEEKASFAELSALFAEAGHSRIPVYRDTLDTVVGMIHIRDAFAILASGNPPPETLESLIRQPLYVPQAMGVLDLLAEMRAKRTHLAMVLDEYSGTEGLVTFEDLVEEIIGDIEDEHDDAPEQLIVALDDGLWDVDARAELDDIADAIDPTLADVEEDVDTIGGLAFILAGRVPEIGEVLLHEPSGWRLEIVDADTRRVSRVRLHPPADAEPVEVE